MSPISFIRIFLTATPVTEGRPITLPILEGPHKLQPILSNTTDLSPHFSLSKTYRRGHASTSLIQRLSINLQCISPPPVRTRQLWPMASVFNSPCVVFTIRFGFTERFRSWDTKLATALSFTLPVPLANAGPTGVGKNQPSNISQDLCLGTDNNFITSRRKAWNTSLMLFFQRKRMLIF